MPRYFRLAALLLTASMAGVAQDWPSSIEGRIVFEDDGTPIAGAMVTAIYFDERFKNLAPWVAGVATADGKGVYRLPRLRGGQYQLCVEAAPGGAVDLVRPCEWGLAGEKLRLPPGVAAKGFDRAIPRGRLLEIEVDDPGEYLDKNEKPGTGVHLLAGLWGPDGLFHTARVTKREKTSRTYAVVAPFGMAVGLDVKGRKLDLDDDKGKAKKDDDAPEPLMEARSASRAAKKVVVKVKGVKP